MRRFIHNLIILCIVGGLFVGAFPAPVVYAHEVDLHVSDEVILKLVSAADLLAITSTYGLAATPLDQFGSRPIYRLRIIDSSAPLLKTQQLIADGRVQYAEPNYLEQAPEGQRHYSWASGQSSGGFGSQWAIASLRLAQAHTVTRGAGVTVAVLDTGVVLSHSALAGQLIDGYDFVDMDSDPSEMGQQGVNIGYGHGTHIAGLVALAAPDAKIMPIRVLDAEGVGNTWVLAEALAYAVNPDGNRHTDDGADVINLSLSTHRPTRLLNEIVTAVTCQSDDDEEEGETCLGGALGVVVVAAAGNHGEPFFEYPAAEGVSGLLAVTAINSANSLPSFANYGSWIHVAAPGEGVISSVPVDGYGVWGGTSMSSALTAGVAALVRSAEPNFTSSDVTGRIINATASINGPISKRVDAAAAVGVQ